MAANPSLEATPSLDDWLAFDADGTVVVRSGKVDIGQRISTAIAMLVADELDIDLGRVEVLRVETGLSPDEGFTSGSQSMSQSGNAVRLAAATARRHLFGRAARALNVDPDTLEVDDGTIHSRATNRKTSYWDLAAGRPLGIDVDPDAPLKPRAALRHIGTAATARGMEELVLGRPYFLHDMSLPGMLHARLVRPPHYHARLTTVDPAVLERLAAEGVEVVRDGSFLAVAATDEYAAVRAAERLAVAASWDSGDGLSSGDIYESLRTNERASLPVVDGTPVEASVPPLDAPPVGAAATLEARYERPYQMHGSLGPSAAMAEFADGRLTVHTHSQGIYFLRAALADAFDMDPEAVRVVHAPGSGCYGHNGADDAAFDAALIARALPGAPVMLKWTREDEHAWEPYGSCASMDLRASLGGGGRIAAWSHETYSDTYSMRPRPGPDKMGAARLLSARFLAEPLAPPVMGPAMGRHMGIHRNLDPLYDLPEKRLVKHLVRGMPLRVSALRSLGGYANVFESFMDELAEEAGSDPVLLPAAPSFGPARPRGNRSGGGTSRPFRRGLPRRPGARDRIRAVHEQRGLCGCRHGSLGRRYRRNPARTLCHCRRCRRDRGPGRPRRPARRRGRPGGELDPSRSGGVRPGRHYQPGLGQLSDSGLRQCARVRNRPDRPRPCAVPRRRRGHDRPHRGGDRECRICRNRTSAPAGPLHSRRRSRRRARIERDSIRMDRLAVGRVGSGTLARQASFRANPSLTFVQRVRSILRAACLTSF